MPEFHNTPNKCITSTSGEQYWISRSCAVAVVVIAQKYDKKFVLMNQRGPGTMDFAGFWNLPCGYIDWNETSGEAAVREVYEETGVDLSQERGVVSFMNQPWYVQSDPAANRQNITLRHGIVLDVRVLPKTTSEHSEPDEISDIRWVPIEDVLDGKYECAFGHDDVVKEFLDKIYPK